MKTTGVIRRIDELGRIVIPKEIRKNLRIKSGENLEIYVSGENIVLSKYSPIENIETTIENYINIFGQVLRHNIIVTDRDKVISVYGNLDDKYLNKEISEWTIRAIERRDSFIERQKKEVNFTLEKENCYFSFSSIVTNSDAVGSVIIFSNETPLSESDEKMAIIISKILSKHFID